MQREGWPEPGSLVVCTVTQVVDFGAFVSLDEYSGKQGLIHISEVASGWIKYIRDHVREGQKIVCKVLNVDTSRHHIDLSLKDVNEHQRREKIQEWKADQKAWKWLEMAYKDKPDDVKRVADALVAAYDSLYLAMEEAAISGSEALAGAKLSEEDLKILESLSKDNVKLPSVDISGYVDITSPAPDGVEIIKKALKQAKRIKELFGYARTLTKEQGIGTMCVRAAGFFKRRFFGKRARYSSILAIGNVPQARLDGNCGI